MTDPPAVHPLWAAPDQAQRLAELTSDDPAEKEAPLRRDVRSLGRLLGDVICEQEGSALFDLVEELRRLTIANREAHGEQVIAASALPSSPGPSPTPSADRDLLERAESIVQRLDVATAHRLTRAFAMFFELSNLAETNHRKRRRRVTRAATAVQVLCASALCLCLCPCLCPRGRRPRNAFRCARSPHEPSP